LGIVDWHSAWDVAIFAAAVFGGARHLSDIGIQKRKMLSLGAHFWKPAARWSGNWNNGIRVFNFAITNLII
jgi:hypothetical protein